MNVLEIRRDLHRHPEVGFTEFRTASIVVQTLKKFGYQVSYGAEVMDAESCRGVPSAAVLENAKQRALLAGADSEIVNQMKDGMTGVVAVLTGSKPGPTVAFRFDMDALPILESDDLEHYPASEGFRSTYDGSMHACGHDGHTAVGLCLAESLADRDFSGTVKFVFQPSEEGLNGAYPMVEKGVVDDVDKLFCLHLGTNTQLGEVVAAKSYLAYTSLLAEFHGVPSHAGSSPEKGKNALLGAATALLNIHAIPRFSTGDTRVNVGVLEGGTASNIIPYYAKMMIETRSDKTEVNLQLKKRVEQIIQASAVMHELSYKIQVIGEAATINCDDELIDVVLEEAKFVKGFQVFTRNRKSTGSEDATLFAGRVQERGGMATYLVVGSPIPAPHHHGKFDFDESTLPMAVNLLYRVAKRCLS